MAYYFTAHIYAHILPDSGYIVVELPASINEDSTELSKERLEDRTVEEIIKPALQHYAEDRGWDLEDVQVREYHLHLEPITTPVVLSFTNGQTFTGDGTQKIFGHCAMNQAPPLQPQNFTGVLSPDGGTIQYTWTDLFNEQHYFIMDENDQILKELSGNVGEWIEPVVCDGQTIRRKLVATNNAGTSVPTYFEMKLPFKSIDRPIELSGRPGDLSSIIWRWHHPESKSVHYELYDADTEVRIAIFETSTKSFIETGLIPGTYARKIRVIGTTQASEFSNTAEVVIPENINEILLPKKVETFVASATGPKTISYAWNYQDPVDGFYICNEFGEPLHAAPGTDREFKEDELESNTDYHRMIRAFNEYGMSPVSEMVTIPLTSNQYKPRITCPGEHKPHYIPQGRINAFKSGVGDGLDVFVKGVITNTNAIETFTIDAMEGILHEKREAPVSAMSLLDGYDWYATDTWVTNYVLNSGQSCRTVFTSYEAVVEIHHNQTEGFTYFPLINIPYKCFTRGHYYEYSEGSYEAFLQAIPEAKVILDVHGYVEDQFEITVTAKAKIWYEDCYQKTLDYTLLIEFDALEPQYIVEDLLTATIEWEASVEEWFAMPFELDITVIDGTSKQTYQISNKDGTIYLWLRTVDGVPQNVTWQIIEGHYSNISLREVLEKYTDESANMLTYDHFFGSGVVLQKAVLRILDENFLIYWRSTGTLETTTYTDTLESVFDMNTLVDSLGSYTVKIPTKINATQNETNKVKVLEVNEVLNEIGRQEQLRVNALKSDGTVQNITHFATYTSSNSAIAKVTEDGIVIGISPGTATIMVNWNGMSDMIPVKVYAPGIVTVAASISNITNVSATSVGSKYVIEAMINEEHKIQSEPMIAEDPVQIMKQSKDIMWPYIKHWIKTHEENKIESITYILRKVGETLE